METVTVNGVPVLADQVTEGADTGWAQRVKAGYGADGQYYDVSETENSTPGARSGAMPAKITQPLPAGDNNIGNMDVASLPPGSLAALAAQTVDLDTGAGTALVPYVAVGLPANGGPVAGGTAANPFHTADDSARTALGAPTDGAAGNDLTSGWSVVSLLKAAVAALRGTLGIGVADGASVALGATTDGAAPSDPTQPATVIGTLKRIMLTLIGTLAIGVADGANAALGATDNPANLTGNAGTLMGYVRGALQSILSWTDSVNGWVNVSLASLLSPLQDGITAHSISGYVTIDTGDAENPFQRVQVKRKLVKLTASGDAQFLAAVALRKFRVLKWRVQSGGAVDVIIKTVADGTILEVYSAGNGGGGGEQYCEHGHFETGAVNQDLTVNLSAPVKTVIQVLYIEVP